MNLRRIVVIIAGLLGTSLLIGVLSAILRGGSTLYTTLKAFSPILLLPIVLMAPLNYTLRLLKWNLFLRRLGVKVTRRASTLTFLAGLGLALIPGKMGELANPVLLKELGGAEMSHALSAAVMLRYTDVLSVIALALLSSRAFPWASLPLGILALAFIGGGVVFASQRAFNWACSLLPARISSKLWSLQSAQQGFRTLLAPSTLALALGLGCVSWGFEGLIVYLALQGFGAQVPPLASLFVVSFSTVSAGISLLPGGIGVAEASITTLLARQGIDPTVGALVTIITRISTVWLGAVIGAVALYIVALELNLKESKL